MLLLQDYGFKNVAALLGGFDAWKRAGLPVVPERPTQNP